MATGDEIERRVGEADAARSQRRSHAAQRVGALAQRRAAIATQLQDIERELGDVLAESSDVLAIDELARFTDIPAADLTRWLNDRKSGRTKRKRPAQGEPGGKNTTQRSLATVTAAKPGPVSKAPEPPGSRDTTTPPVEVR